MLQRRFLQGCSDSGFSVGDTGALIPTPEPQVVTVTAPRCGYVFSSYLTPTLLTPLPTTAITAAGSLVLTGARLGSKAMRPGCSLVHPGACCACES